MRSTEYTVVKQNVRSFADVSQMTPNGSIRRSACLEAARRLLLRKMARQEARRQRVGEADFTP